MVEYPLLQKFSLKSQIFFFFVSIFGKTFFLFPNEIFEIDSRLSDLLASIRCDIDCSLDMNNAYEIASAVLNTTCLIRNFYESIEIFV